MAAQAHLSYYLSNTLSPVQPVISALHFSQSTEARSSDTTSQKARFGPIHRKLLQAHLQFIICLETRRTSCRQALHEPCLLPAQQSAYRLFHSTETAVLSVADAESVRDRLTSCVSEVAKWCASRRLQLNDDKTEMIWFGLRSNLAKLQ